MSSKKMFLEVFLCINPEHHLHIQKIEYGGNKMNLYDEYKPLVKDVCGSKKYYIVLNENQIEVDIDIFIQFFGVHKTICINGTRTYHIIVKDICDLMVSKMEYNNFNSFISELIKYKNICTRYIEQSEQTELNLYKRMIYQPEKIEDIVFKKLLLEKIYNAISQLNEIQRRRFIMHYLDEMTYDKIAEIEGCTKRAIKFSVDAARKNLQAELKNLYLDYTNK